MEYYEKYDGSQYAVDQIKFRIKVPWTKMVRRDFVQVNKIQFEETVKKIEKFTGIQYHVRKKSLFNPSVSVNNTQLFSKYKKYDSDIRKIEEKLPFSLFPFENYSHIETVSNVIF